MKRQENKYRFNVWDYLWWLGEKWQQSRRSSRVNGSMSLFGYIMALIIAPLIFLFIRLFPDTVIMQVIVWVVVILLGYSWIEMIYRRRGKAILKHYAKRSSHEAIAVLLFILSTAIMIFLMWFWCNFVLRV